MSGSNRFWLETTAWSLAHYLVYAALYWASRNLLLSLLLMYVWESIELAIYLLAGNRYAVFVGTAGTTERESVADSLIGDPLIGGLGIATFALADAFVAPLPVCCAHTWQRAAVFLLQAASLFCIDWRTRTGVRYGVAISLTAYTVIGAIAYGLDSALVLLWLGVAIVQGILVFVTPAPNTNNQNALRAVWLRVWTLGIVVAFGVAFVAGAVKTPGSHPV